MTLDKKPIIWMAGDSTMQSYFEENRPQWGWGELLLEKLEENGSEITTSHREDSPFPQQKRYHGNYFLADNCAMAGRSSKTFREEGRLQDIADHIGEGDYLLIQFGHNDAGKGKPERYVALEDFRASLQYFTDVALSHGAKPILLSSIVLCPSPETEQGEAGEISRLLPAYGEEMCKFALELGIPFVDMNELTRACLAGKTKEEAERMYMPDHVHLQREGAEVYAELAARALAEFMN